MSPCRKCLLCQDDFTVDSIEHYAVCRITKWIMEQRFALAPSVFGNLHSLLLCSPDIQTEEQLGGLAIIVYGLYTTTNNIRHGTDAGRLREVDRIEATVEATKEAVKGHKRATEIFRSRWIVNYEPRQIVWSKDIWTPAVGHKRKVAQDTTHIARRR